MAAARGMASLITCQDAPQHHQSSDVGSCGVGAHIQSALIGCDAPRDTSVVPCAACAVVGSRLAGRRADAGCVGARYFLDLA